MWALVNGDIIARIYRVGRKKIEQKLLVTILVVWQLLSGLCLTHTMLWGCDIEERGLLLLCILLLNLN